MGFGAGRRGEAFGLWWVWMEEGWCGDGGGEEKIGGVLAGLFCCVAAALSRNDAAS